MTAVATHAYLQSAYATDSKHKHTWELPSTTTVLSLITELLLGSKSCMFNGNKSVYL